MNKTALYPCRQKYIKGRERYEIKTMSEIYNIWQEAKFIAYVKFYLSCFKCLAIMFHFMQNRVNKLGWT